MSPRECNWCGVEESKRTKLAPTSIRIRERGASEWGHALACRKCSRSSARKFVTPPRLRGVDVFLPLASALLVACTNVVGEQGPPGEQGPQGQRGAKGAQGAAGPPGKSGASSLSFYIVTASDELGAPAKTQAKCDAGDVATGGGCSWGAGVVARESIPLADPLDETQPIGWWCIGEGTGAIGTFAICLERDQ